MRYTSWLSLVNIKALLLFLLAASLPLEHTPAIRYACVGFLFLLSLGGGNNLRRGNIGWLVYPSVAWIILPLSSLLWSVAPSLTERHWFSDVLVPLLALLGAYSCREIAGKLFKPCLLIFTWTLFLTAIGHLFEIDTIAFYYSGFGISSTLALMIIPFWLGLLWGSNSSWRRVAAWHVMLLLMVGLISGNRMFWVVFFAVLLLFVFLRYPLGLKKTVLLGITGLLMALIPLYFIYIWRLGGDGGFNGFGNMFVHDPRFVVWNYWLSLAWKTPWLGIGFGRSILNHFYGGSVPAELLAVDGNIAQHAHNVFINVFLQLGAIGVLVYATLVASLLCRTYKNFMNSRMDMFWAAPFISLLAVLIKNQTDDFLVFATPVAAMFFLGMALAYSDGFSAPSPTCLDRPVST